VTELLVKLDAPAVRQAPRWLAFQHDTVIRNGVAAQKPHTGARSIRVPNQYRSVNAPSVSACHSFSGVVAI
jgi:hypothetical protein